MKPLIIILALFVVMACESDEFIAPQIDDGLTAADININSASKSAAFPSVIPLPNGFQPEGITSGIGTDFYVGSLANGDIYKGDLRDGSGTVFIEANPGEQAVGLDFDERTGYLYVAGAFGVARIYDGASAELIASIQLNTIPFPGTLINDVIVTKDAAYFTDSFQPLFYKVSLMPDGTLPDPISFETISLGGEYNFIVGGINGNGIVSTPGDKHLILGNLDEGQLYLVDPVSGEATKIDLMGEFLPGADGLAREGRHLYVVQNVFNRVAVVELSPDMTSGMVTRYITDPEYKIPATATLFGSKVYVVNARFDVAPPFEGYVPDIEFDVVGVDKN